MSRLFMKKLNTLVLNVIFKKNGHLISIITQKFPWNNLSQSRTIITQKSNVTNVNIKLSGNYSSTHMIRYHGSTEFYCDQCDLNADTRLLFGSTLKRYILKKVYLWYSVEHSGLILRNLLDRCMQGRFLILAVFVEYNLPKMST